MGLHPLLCAFATEIRKAPINPCKHKVYWGFHTIYIFVFPYIFPLQIQNILDKIFHPYGAGGFHLFTEMSVNIQSKSG